MKKIIYICIMVFFCWFNVASAQQITVSGYGTTTDEAERDALRNAVEQAVGTLVDSATLVQNNMLINDEIYTRATDLLAEQHITDYIILRNTITNDYDELIARWGPGEIVYWFSARPVYEAFYRGDVTHNIVQFKEKGLQRFVKVEWVRPLTMGLWQAQYLTMDVLPGVEKVDTKIWRATMRIAFLRLPFKTKEDQIKNPFGFVVQNYSLSYVGTPETSAHYLERARELTEGAYQ